MSVRLDEREERLLSGADGKAMQFAMRMIVAAADVAGATELVPIEMAHINSCHYSGPMSLDFAEFLLAGGARLAVPTHTNASLISCSSPDLRPASESRDAVEGARRVMEIYEQLGLVQVVRVLGPGRLGGLQGLLQGAGLAVQHGTGEARFYAIDGMTEDDDAVDVLSIVVPYTVGEWQWTDPVTIHLSPGTNVLSFSRETPNFGLSIKDITCTPTES